MNTERERPAVTLKPRRGAQPEAKLRRLARGWLRGEISNAQLTEALGRKPHAIGSAIATVMYALRRGVTGGTDSI